MEAVVVKRIIFICCLVISLFVSIYFFHVLDWLDEQFSIWCRGCMEWHSEAKSLIESPYYPTIIPVIIIYFVVAIALFICLWRYRKNFWLLVSSIPLVVSNLITAIILYLVIMGFLYSDYPIKVFPINISAIIVFFFGGILCVRNLMGYKRKKSEYLN